LVANLVSIQYTLYGMSVDASPVTSEFCERKPELCWPPSKPQDREDAASRADTFVEI
jgi:hypothetical protein